MGAQLVHQIVEIARSAGAEILGVYRSRRTTHDLKPDGSPVTLADMLAHAAIIGRLRALTPDIPVLSEESEEATHEDRLRWSRHWLVDPLDGTKEFLSGNGEFTVNIALIEDHRPVLGVVHAPALALTYCANATAAFRIRGEEEPHRIRAARYSGGPLRIVSSRSHGNGRLETFLSTLGECERVPVGSSLKFCLVAEGSAHVYPRLGPTREWDTAAGQCIVEAAGGKVTDLENRTLAYNKPTLLNPAFIAAGQLPVSTFRAQNLAANRQEHTA